MELLTFVLTGSYKGDVRQADVEQALEQYLYMGLLLDSKVESVDLESTGYFKFSGTAFFHGEAPEQALVHAEQRILLSETQSLAAFVARAIGVDVLVQDISVIDESPSIIAVERSAGSDASLGNTETVLISSAVGLATLLIMFSALFYRHRSIRRR